MRRNGFTIIELIVIIVVIAILASISIVGYGSWRKNAAEVEVKTDLHSAVVAMESARNFQSTYPLGIPTNFRGSQNVDLRYVTGDAVGFCLEAQSKVIESVTYYVNTTDQTEPIEGTCIDGVEAPGGGTIADNGGNVTTLAGSEWGFVDGQGANAQFRYPFGVTVDSSGNVYVGDGGNNRIRKISPSGNVTTLAGSTSGYADGQGASAQFNSPGGVAIDNSGNVYVADVFNHRIRKISPSGNVTTLAGSTQGYADGQGTSAQFTRPTYVALDSSGNVYVTDRGNNRIRKISPSGNVTTLAGSTSGYADGQGASAQFNSPTGIALDSSGNVYVSDYGNNRIRKISPSGNVTTLAGSTSGYADGQKTSAQFFHPAGLALDSNGVLYVADGDNNRIRKIE